MVCEVIIVKSRVDDTKLRCNYELTTKPSMYNFYIDCSDAFSKGPLIFNARSASLIQVDFDTYTRIKNSKINEIAPNIIEELKTGDFLVNKGINEIAEISASFRNIQKQKEKKLSITIAPTLNCNLACQYCFQNDYRSSCVMNKRTCAQIVKFVKENLPNDSVLHINWFGGEPLLCTTIIEDLSRELINISKEKRSQYLASIVTNGTLLDAETARMLEAAKVRSCQITIDGLKEIHDKRRPSKNGTSSFIDIVNNISSIKSDLSIVIRCTVDDTNILSAWDLFDYLNQKGLFATDKIKFMIGYTSDSNIPSSCRIDENNLVKVNEGYKARLHNKGLIIPYPFPSFGCMATNSNSLAIGPSGEIYKCIASIGRYEEAVGNICDFKMGESSDEELWLALDPLKESKCNNCSLLPICYGGCRKAWKQVGEPDCPIQWKNLEDLVRIRDLQVELHENNDHKNR